MIKHGVIFEEADVLSEQSWNLIFVLIVPKNPFLLIIQMIDNRIIWKGKAVFVYCLKNWERLIKAGYIVKIHQLFIHKAFLGMLTILFSWSYTTELLCHSQFPEDITYNLFHAIFGDRSLLRKRDHFHCALN